jgi:hypothetical protein
MVQSSTERNQLRKAQVLELLAKGNTERQIATAIRTSQSTVHRCIVELRAEAINQLQDYISNLPHTWDRAVCSMDLLIKRANDLLERKGLEVDQELSAIKVLCDLNDKRLALFSSPQVIRRVMQDRDKLKAKIESLQRTSPKYEAVVSVEQEAGKPDKRKSRIIRKRLTAAIQEGPIV